MATTLGGTAHHPYAEPRISRRTATVRPHTRSWAISLSMLGLVTLLAAAWGGIIPYVGPVFGYSADGAGSWYWNLQHATLALIPGAVACVAALSLMLPISRERAASTRVGLSVAGLVLIACGAWFVIGPVAWPVLSTGTYFVPASPLMTLANEVGYSLGVGVLLASCGAFALGWAARHNAPLEALGQGGDGWRCGHDGGDRDAGRCAGWGDARCGSASGSPCTGRPGRTCRPHGTTGGGEPGNGRPGTGASTRSAPSRSSRSTAGRPDAPTDRGARRPVRSLTRCPGFR